MNMQRLSTTTRRGTPLVLTPVTDEDTGRVHALCQDPEIPRWTTIPSPYSLSDAEAFVNDYVAVGWNRLDQGTFTAEPQSPELVWGVRVEEGPPTAGLWGVVGLKPLGDGEVEIGWWLGKDARGHGIMRAAVARVVEAAFSPGGSIQADAVRWFALIGNHGSATIAQRTGFTYTGTAIKQDQECWSAVIRSEDPIEPRSDWPELPS